MCIAYYVIFIYNRYVLLLYTNMSVNFHTKEILEMHLADISILIEITFPIFKHFYMNLLWHASYNFRQPHFHDNTKFEKEPLNTHAQEVNSFYDKNVHCVIFRRNCYSNFICFAWGQ